jgi:O-antigen/teichoic acid export membrane protein
MKAANVKKDLVLAGSVILSRKIVGYIVFVLLARYLDKNALGEFFFAATVTSFFAVLTELGTTKYLNRRIAEDGARAIQSLSEVVSIRVPLMAFVFLVLNTVVCALNPKLAATFVLTSIYVILQDFYYSFGATFLGLRKVGYRVVTDITAQVLLALAVLLTVILGGGLYVVLGCYVLSNVVLVGFSVALTRRKIGRPTFVWDLAAIRPVVSDSFPFFLIALLELLHLKVDTVMLGMIDSLAAVASYEAAFKLLEVAQFPIRPAAMILFPICAGLAANGAWPEFTGLLKKLVAVTVVLGLGLAVIVEFGAHEVIPFVFGSKYESSIEVVRILYLAAPALLVGFVAVFLANALHLERKLVLVLGACVMLNVLLNAIAIPVWGPVGAAWATVVTQNMLAVWVLALIVRELQTLRMSPALGTEPSA